MNGLSKYTRQVVMRRRTRWRSQRCRVDRLAWLFSVITGALCSVSYGDDVSDDFFELSLE